MNNEEYEILEDDVTEHANLPKISVNTPSFIHKNSVEIIDNSCYNTTREELNLNKRINDKRKLTLKLENNPLNKKVIYEKIYISNSNRNCFTKSQRLGKEKNLHKKIIKNSPKIENGLRNTIEIGNHALNKKKIFKNGIVNSEPGNTSPHNINHLNKKIIIKKDNNQNIDEIKTNDNKLNIRKNNKKNTINGSELHQKPKIEKLNSENINLRGSKRIINRSKDFNNIKFEINKSLKLVEPKEIVDQEIRKINIKKISIINGRHIHSIKCFNSNSSQALFNTNINNSVIIDKNIPKFKKMIDFKENENENSIINKTKIINDNTYQNNLYNSKSEVNINSYFKKGFSNEINNNFFSKINLKKKK